jgi:pyrophosphate--fructose-6-phosphate 1-phosphotransferase
LLSGGPASGGHNIIAGIKKALGDKNTLLGVKSGPKGLMAGDIFEVKNEDIDHIINTGGFDYLGSDRTKIKTKEQFEKVKAVCQQNKLNAIIVVGGDDSNTNAGLLAEYLFDLNVQVIGVPKTIDGDLQVQDLLPISFGFDTATKIYSELVGNILQDTPSSRKYWHFVKLMGRSASHVALEVALQTQPAWTLISEEVSSKNMSLSQVVDQIVNVIVARSQKKINHGVVIIPEGLIEFIPEMNRLIDELNDLVPQFEQELQKADRHQKRDIVLREISANNKQLFNSLPNYIKDMLLLDRDAHGNLQVSQIPTETLLIDMAREKIERDFPNVPFAANKHFFGYEGRCGAPTLFDLAYTYNLGLTAGSLVLSGFSGYMASLTGLDHGGKPVAIPLPGLMNIEKRSGHDEMVIKKYLVDLNAPAFKYFASRREAWAKEDIFSSPGPRQLWGPTSHQMPISVALNSGYSSLDFQL